MEKNKKKSYIILIINYNLYISCKEKPLKLYNEICIYRDINITEKFIMNRHCNKIWDIFKYTPNMDSNKSLNNDFMKLLKKHNTKYYYMDIIIGII